MEIARRVLIVEDDNDTRTLIRRELENAAYRVDEFATGAAFQSRSDDPFDLLILDVGLPDVDGFELCRRLRNSGSTVPVIFVTSRAEEIDRVSGFALGADDYVTKPFSAKELTFRVKALLRRCPIPEQKTASPSDGSQPLQFGPLSIDIYRRKAALHQTEVQLTALEFDVLSFLASHPGKPFTREELTIHVWGLQSSQYDATVTTLLNRLRRKLEPDVRNPAFIKTVFGVGYRFVDPATEKIEA